MDIHRSDRTDSRLYIHGVMLVDSRLDWSIVIDEWMQQYKELSIHKSPFMNWSGIGHASTMFLSKSNSAGEPIQKPLVMPTSNFSAFSLAWKLLLEVRVRSLQSLSHQCLCSRVCMCVCVCSFFYFFFCWFFSMTTIVIARDVGLWKWRGVPKFKTMSITTIIKGNRIL